MRTRLAIEVGHDLELEPEQLREVLTDSLYLYMDLRPRGGHPRELQLTRLAKVLHASIPRMSVERVKDPPCPFCKAEDWDIGDDGRTTCCSSM